MKKSVLVSSLGIITMFAVSACGTTSQSPQSANPSTAPTNATVTNTSTNTASTTAKPYNLSLKIITGKMDGKPGWPKYVPADLTLPANTVINVTIKDYDDGPAGIPTGDNVVKGTIGNNMTVDGKTVSSVSAKNVAHTLTITSIGLNVPVPPKTSKEKFATVKFSFKTPAKAQKLNWQCMAACGTGSSGWQGAMSTDGWMKGVWTVN